MKLLRRLVFVIALLALLNPSPLNASTAGTAHKPHHRAKSISHSVKKASHIAKPASKMKKLAARPVKKATGYVAALAAPAPAQAAPAPALETVPAKTLVLLAVDAHFTSGQVQFGEDIPFYVVRPVLGRGGNILIPIGAEGHGTITFCEPAAPGGMPGKLSYSCGSVRAADGSEVTFDAAQISVQGGEFSMGQSFNAGEALDQTPGNEAEVEVGTPVTMSVGSDTSVVPEPAGSSQSEEEVSVQPRKHKGDAFKGAVKSFDESSVTFTVADVDRTLKLKDIQQLLVPGITEQALISPPPPESAAGPPSSASENVSSASSSVFDWRDVPLNEPVLLQSAAFDEGGYQLYDTAGETIVVPFENQNLYVLKFARSSDGSMYFVNQGDFPLLTIPDGGYLSNSTVDGARWYPFPGDYNPVTPVYLGIAPSWDDYVAMGWYPEMSYWGGYYSVRSPRDGGLFRPMYGTYVRIDWRDYHDWDEYHQYSDSHPGWHRTEIYNKDFYRKDADSSRRGQVFTGSARPDNRGAVSKGTAWKAGDGAGTGLNRPDSGKTDSGRSNVNQNAVRTGADLDVEKPTVLVPGNSGPILKPGASNAGGFGSHDTGNAGGLGNHDTGNAGGVGNHDTGTAGGFGNHVTGTAAGTQSPARSEAHVFIQTPSTNQSGSNSSKRDDSRSRDDKDKKDKTSK